jgi:hypothetical protein
MPANPGNLSNSLLILAIDANICQSSHSLEMSVNPGNLCKYLPILDSLRSLEISANSGMLCKYLPILEISVNVCQFWESL